MPRLFCTALLGAVLAFSVFAALLLVAGGAHASPPPPRTPAGLPATIEPLAPYVEEVACDPTVRPGTARLARLLASTYRSYSATSWASTYSCGTDGDRSEHYDGRAIDWMVSVRSPRQFAAAKAALHWLLATDAAGNRFAMARRLGVMYLIYDNRMWGSWDGRWHDYNGCGSTRSRAYDNSCHRTHVHVSLSWNGAMGTTSFWTKRVSAPDFGPCRPRDLNWAGRYTRPNHAGCPQYAPVHAAKRASAVKKALVKYSGAPVRHGWGGPAVTAVQQALRVGASGSFGAATTAAVKSFQRRHHLAQSGVMTASTWRALLAATH
jgi:peptidoglycan hydrolase-like protein with peptidoglycan-binding domain